MLNKGKIMTGVVVLNYNTPKQTVECVSSIIKFEGNHIKIVVVDNCSTDNSAVILKEYCENLTNVLFVMTPYNGGYSYGNNYGTLFFEKDIKNIVFINSDVILKNDAITKMKNMLNSVKDLAVVGPQILDKNGLYVQFARKKIRSIDYLLERRPIGLLNIKTSRNIKLRPRKREIFRGMVSGCCFMIEKSIFDEIGGFDENLFLYSEEDVIAYKLDSLMYKAGISEDALILHLHSESISKQGLAFRRKFSLLSPLYCLKVYEKKHFWLLYLCYFNALAQYGLYSLFIKTYRENFLDFLRRFLIVVKI